ncbi:MAG TPA: PucR family transcriptional regulator ligand-binding domain-containing protein, partial [Pseudonocardia sp.]
MSFTEPLPPTLRLASTGTLTYGLSVGEVLGVPALSGARVIAGENGLGRVIQRLNVMEVPDILGWVKPHELLLTTGYPLRNTPQSLGHLVADLDERGLAAIAVKLGRYLDGLPNEMIEQADRLGFPLILLPNDVGFDDILNQVLTDILNRQAAILARTEEVHRALVQIVLCGGGLQEITDEVAALLGAAVAVIDSDGRELAASGDQRYLAELRTGDPGTAEFGEHDDRTVVPVVAGGYTYGRMAAVGESAPEAGMLERAATVAALVITKQQAVSAVESKYRADFLRDVLTG